MCKILLKPRFCFVLGQTPFFLWTEPNTIQLNLMCYLFSYWLWFIALNIWNSLNSNVIWRSPSVWSNDHIWNCEVFQRLLVRWLAGTSLARFTNDYQYLAVLAGLIIFWLWHSLDMLESWSTCDRIWTRLLESYFASQNG